MAAGHVHHSDGHAHTVRDPRNADRRRLRQTLLLAAGYMVAEILGGLATNSLALLADAGHMFSDIAALGLALIALWVARKPPTPQRSYGYYRAEILAALANAATLIAAAIYIFVEAFHRFRDPPEVRGPLMMGIAAGGLAVNLAGMRLLHASRSTSLNLRGAWLHAATDALGSVGALITGGLIWALGWNWADPVTSVLIGLLVLYSSWRLLAASVSVLMESSPRHIDVDRLRDELAGQPGVLSVHDLHVWSVTSGLDVLSVHVVAEEGEKRGALLLRLRDMLHERFGIDHATIQIEPKGFAERVTPI